ncbi:MAG TPA: ATP synthase F1 subunit delta, partial [Accumulibacter sp.]|nr:ATP synthase F1 subunit delta [Accumulibacter sp.]
APAMRAAGSISLIGKAQDGSEANLIDVLANNERLSALPEIAGLFEELRAAQEGVKEATIYSAFPVDDAQLKALIEDLEARFKTRLTAEVVVDQSLIGGVKIVVGDQVLDTSVRGKLESLSLALKN